jgi:hypothetical protein
MVRSLMVVAAMTALSLAGPAARSEIIAGDPNSRVFYALSDVLDAGGIRVGELTFTDFRLVSTAGAGASAADANDILLSALCADGTYGLAFNGSWTAVAGGRADTTLAFKVSLADPLLLLHDNSLSMSAYGATGGGLVLITENVYDADPLWHPSTARPLASEVVYYHSDADYCIHQHRTFALAGRPAAVPQAWIVKDIHVTSDGAGSAAALSEFSQSVGLIPEPATMLLLALGAPGLLIRRR